MPTDPARDANFAKSRVGPRARTTSLQRRVYRYRYHRAPVFFLYLTRDRSRLRSRDAMRSDPDAAFKRGPDRLAAKPCWPADASLPIVAAKLDKGAEMA